MKSISSALLCMLMLMVCACSVVNAQTKENPKKVIIAVNTPHGVGYFTDNKGTFLFNKQFEWVGKFSEGLAIVKQNGKWGFINTKGEVVIPCIYDFADSFSEGLDPVKQNGKWSIINTKGKVIVAECEWLLTSWSVVEL